MNYNDQILENKPFNFFKQLMYNIALSICIVLVGVLILVYGFKFRLYEVVTGSEEPYLPKGCMVVVKAQDEYKVGEIIKFDTSPNKTVPTAHRLIAIRVENGTTYYICHGDAVQNTDGTYSDTSDWEDDVAYVNSLIEQDPDITISELKAAAKNIQTPTASQVEGKVIGHIDNYGTYLNFIKQHYMLFIALVAAIWCISSTVQNEIDIKKSRRLM